MKNIKSILALIMAVCLMLCLAVPAFATEATSEATTGSNQEAVTPEAGDIDMPLGTGDEVDGDETKDTTPETTAPHDHDHEGEDSTETTGADEEKMGVLQIVLIVVEVIASVALVAVVLMQSGKESGLSGALSGNSDSYLSKSGKSLDKTLAKATKWIALVWILLTLALNLF